MAKRQFTRDLLTDPLLEPKVGTNQEKPKRQFTDPDVDLRTKSSGITQVGRTGLGESQFDQGTPMEALANLQQIRAAKQPWHNQAANMIERAVVSEIVAGTIEGIGYLGDIQGLFGAVTQQEDEWGNWLSDIGKDIREANDKNFQIYQKQPGKVDFTDSGYWFDNGVSVASSLSMLIPSMAGAKALSLLGKGLSKGAGMIKKSFDVAAQMGKQSKWLASGITQAITSRHIENTMEASGTFDQKYEEYLEEGLDENLSRKLAAEAASFNYNAGWAMLMQDIPQYLLIGKIFNPITGKVQSKMAQLASKGTKPGFGKKAMTGITNMAGEGLEEGYQFVIAEEGKYRSDLKAGLIDEKEFDERLSEYAKDGELWTSMIFGALGGGLFQLAGPKAGQLFKGKKTKDNEANWKKIQEDHVRARAKEIASANDIVAATDEANDADGMLIAREGLNLKSTINAIEMDKFDLHIETMREMLNMTPEQKAALEKDGIEVNEELFKEYIPKMIEQAHDIQNDYLKLRSKNSAGIARGMAYNNHYIKKFGEMKNESHKKMNEMISSVEKGSDLSVNGKKLLLGRMKIRALKDANIWLEKNSKGDKTTKQIADNLAVIKKQESANNKTLASDTRDQDTKTRDNKTFKAFQAAESLGSIKAEMKMQNIADHKILEYQEEIIKMGTNAYKKKYEKSQADAKLSVMVTETQIKAGIKDVESNDLFDAKEKAERIEGLEGRLKAIKSAASKKEEEAKLAEIAKQVELDKELANQSNTTVTPEKAVAQETAPDIYDDPLGKYDDDLTTRTIDEQNTAADSNTNSDMRVLDTPGSSTNKAWLVNGQDKTGTPVEYVLGDGAGVTPEIGSLRKQALDIYNSGTINEFVYRNLPIRINFNNDRNNYSYILDANAFYGNDADGEKGRQSFEDIDMPERINIINAMVKGDAKSTVSKQYGGNLNSQPVVTNKDGEKSYPLNSVMDLLPFKNKSVEDLDIAVSDENGDLMDEDKELHPRLRHTMMMQDLNDSGQPVPYAGGVFLNIPKAGGHPFPLRLELEHHTVEEAQTIAELIAEIGVTKSIKYKHLVKDLKDINPDLYARIQENHKEELALIGKDGTVVDFLDTFVYISDKTNDKKSQLSLSGIIVKFNNKFAITKDNMEIGVAALADFLHTQKRRQFNVKRWAKTDPNHKKYREYIVKNVLKTRAIANEPLFTPGQGNDKKRHASLYIKSMGAPEVGSTQDERLAETRELGIVKNPKTGKFESTYINKKGERTVYEANDRKEMISIIDDAYASEESDDIALPQAPKKVVEKVVEIAPVIELKDSEEAIKKKYIGVPEGRSIELISLKKDAIKKYISFGENNIIEVDAIRLNNISGLEIFAYKSKGRGYTVFEGSTGVSIGGPIGGFGNSKKYLQEGVDNYIKEGDKDKKISKIIDDMKGDKASPLQKMNKELQLTKLKDIKMPDMSGVVKPKLEIESKVSKPEEKVVSSPALTEVEARQALWGYKEDKAPVKEKEVVKKEIISDEQELQNELDDMSLDEDALAGMCD